MQYNQTFSIDTIQLQRFDFEQIHPIEEDTLPLTINQNISAMYQHQDNVYDIILVHALNILDKNDTNVYNIDSSIIGKITVKENFDKRLLNNVVAILYSYLRPMVAQITVMAKLPPLDLPPIDLSNFEIEELNEIESSS